jgi:hypothetical protein
MKSYHFIGPGWIKVIYTLLLIAGALLVFFALSGRDTAGHIPGYFVTSEGVVTESGSARMARVRFPLQNGEPFTAPIPAAPGKEQRFYGNGERLIVYYNPISPRELVVVKRSFWGPNSYLFLGIILAGFGFRLFVAEFMRGMRRRVILEHGRRIRPHRVEVKETAVRLLLITRYNACYLHCEWDGPGQYGTRTFLSEFFPPRLLDKLDPQRTDLYFLENNPAVYFIPLPYADAPRNAPQNGSQQQ